MAEGPASSDGGQRLGEPGSVHVLTEDGEARVVLSGEVDAEMGPALLEALTDALAARSAVRVDVRHVTFMDSTGLDFIARLSSGARTPPTVVGATDDVRFLLELSGVGDLVVLVDAPGPA